MPLIAVITGVDPGVRLLLVVVLAVLPFCVDVIIHAADIDTMLNWNRHRFALEIPKDAVDLR